MHRGTCYNCGYYKEERDADGNLYCYCNDLDCICDPTDPDCNYH